MKNREIIKYYKEILLICKPFWKYGVYGGIFGLIFSIFNLPGPFLTKYVIDKILPSKNVTFLNIIVILMFFFILSKIISNFLNNLFLFLFRSKSTILLQAELFNHMEYLPMDFYKKYNTGECVSRILNDVSNLQGLIGDTILQIFKNIFTFLIGIGVLFFLNVKLAFISFFTLPFYLYFANFYSLEIRKISGELQQKYSYLYNLLFENIFSIPLIKAFCLEERQYKIVFNQLTSIFSTHLKLRKVSLLFSSIASFIGALGPLLILWIGVYEIIGGRLTLGSFVAFNSFLGYLYSSIEGMIGINTIIQTSFASSKRIFEILPLPREEKGNIKLKKLRGNIEYEKISFSYDGINFVFKDLSLYIKEKEKVLIIGKSGVGKTTLVNLLIKFYLPQKGEIYLDGLSIKKIDVFSLRKKLGVVFQVPFIFSGTIRDNLLIANPYASEKEIINALRIANIYEFIMSLPEKIDSDVGERGSLLSMGQKQKIAIARVILKKPDILILDEALSNVDKESEKLIFEAILKDFEDKTMICISHRYDNIINYVDKIFLFEDGKIKEIKKEVKSAVASI